MFFLFFPAHSQKLLFDLIQFILVALCPLLHLDKCLVC
jgi:hypothetical protein